MGAGVTGGYFVFQKARQVDQEQLYTTIGQQRTAQGVSITVRKAYADAGSSIIAYRIQVAPNLAQRYDQVYVTSYVLTDQFGDEPRSANIECDRAPFLDVGFAGGTDCVADVAPFPVASGTSQLTLSFTVRKVVLMHSGQTADDTLTDSWSFTFTIPYHQTSLGPGGPYAQPAR
jgi:hypothetical protein